jgi:hypothetical protein
VAKASESGHLIVVGRMSVRVTHETVPIGSLKLDPENPRIRFQLKRLGKAKVTQDDLRDLIRKQPGYDGTHKSIRKAGGLTEPVIIRNDGTVVEGNSRTTAITALHKGNPSDPSWKSIPVTRLPKDVPEKAIAMLMAGYHVAGKAKWAAFAQAEHIHYLKEVSDYSVDEIADETRMSKKDVFQYIDAYKYLIEEVLPRAGKASGEKVLKAKFSHALEFIKNRKLGDLRKDKGVRKTFADLLVKDKIKGAEVRELSTILKDKRATKELKANGFKEAKEILKKADPSVARADLRQMQKLTAKISKMTRFEWDLFSTNIKARKILEDLTHALEELMRMTRPKRAVAGG